MTRLIRQKHSGKVLKVVREDALWLRIINPDYPSTPFLISRAHYDMKWEPYTDSSPISSQTGIEQETPQPKKRGRPKGSKNKVKT